MNSKKNDHKRYTYFYLCENSKKKCFSLSILYIDFHKNSTKSHVQTIDKRE